MVRQGSSFVDRIRKAIHFHQKFQAPLLTDFVYGSQDSGLEVPNL